MRATLAGLTLFAAAPFVAAQAPANVNDQIETAWKDREEKVRTASFQIRLSGTFFKGGMSAHPLANTPGGKNVFGGKVVPAADTPIAADLRYVLDGMKCRIESSGTLWNGQEIRDGVRQATVSSRGLLKRLEYGRLAAPQGRIDDKQTYSYAMQDDYRPLGYWGRGLNPAVRAFRIDDLKPAGVTSVIGGRVCQLLVLTRAAADRDEYWLDPGRDWVVVREKYVAPNGGGTQLDIEYQPDAACGWVPKAWTYRDNLSPQQSISIQSYTVTAYTVNAPVPPDEFEITFPIGTEVSDNRIQGPERYHTVKTPTTETVEPSAPTRPVWVYGALLGCGALLVVGVFAYRARRTRPAPA